jgi:hypothetical protein
MFDFDSIVRIEQTIDAFQSSHPLVALGFGDDVDSALDVLDDFGAVTNEARCTRLGEDCRVSVLDGASDVDTAQSRERLRTEDCEGLTLPVPHEHLASRHTKPDELRYHRLLVVACLAMRHGFWRLAADALAARFTAWRPARYRDGSGTWRSRRTQLVFDQQTVQLYPTDGIQATDRERLHDQALLRWLHRDLVEERQEHIRGAYPVSRERTLDEWRLLAERPPASGSPHQGTISGEAEWLAVAEWRVREVQRQARIHEWHILGAKYPQMGPAKRKLLAIERAAKHAQLANARRQLVSLRHRYNARRYAEGIAIAFDWDVQRVWGAMERKRASRGWTWAATEIEMRFLSRRLASRHGLWCIPVPGLVAPQIREHQGELRASLDADALAALEIRTLARDLEAEIRPFARRIAEIVAEVSPPVAVSTWRPSLIHLKVNDDGHRIIVPRATRTWDLPVAA